MTNADTAHIETLHLETRELLDMDDKERIAYLGQEKWIPYPRANEVLDRMEELLALPKRTRMPSFLLCADSHMGKSSIAKEFVRRHPPTNGLHADAHPVIFVEAPDLPDTGWFYDKIFAYLSLPVRTRDKVSKKESEIDYYFRELNVKMLLVDEIHNILSGSRSKQSAFMIALKGLNNRLQIPIGLIGTQDARRAITTDNQISSRFPPITLSRWKIDRDYLSLLASIETTLPLRRASRLPTKELAPAIHDLTEGLTGEILDLITQAAAIAIKSKSERITKAELDACNFIRPSLRITESALAGGQVVESAS